MKVKRRQNRRSSATRGELIKAAYQLFGRRGYANVSIDQIAARAGVTKGACYHHFRDKRELFQQVLVNIEEKLAQSIQKAISKTDDPIVQLVDGSRIFLDACLDPAQRQIGLIDAPSVLGWRKRRQIDMNNGLGIMISILERAMEKGVIKRQPAKPLAHLILGAALEAGMLIAHAEDERAMQRMVSKPLLRMIAELRGEEGAK